MNQVIVDQGCERLERDEKYEKCQQDKEIK